MAFNALMLLVRHQEQHLACKKSGRQGAGVVICVERGANVVQLMPLPPHFLFFFKFKLV